MAFDVTSVTIFSDTFDESVCKFYFHPNPNYWNKVWYNLHPINFMMQYGHG